MEEKEERTGTTAEEIRRRLPEERTIYELAELFKMFGDPTRAKILGCLQIRDLYGIRPYSCQRGTIKDRAFPCFFQGYI